MTDWSKLRVPDLRAELKKRGLSQTGLKAELVARLTAAENETGFESETTIKADSVSAALDSNTPTEEAIETSPASVEARSEIVPVIETQVPAVSEDLASSTSARDDLEIALPEAEASTLQVNQTSSGEVQQGIVSPSPVLSADAQEAIEDTQKRKRRSQSPPPSTIEIRRKRARADDEFQPGSDVQTRIDESLTPIEDVKEVEDDKAIDHPILDVHTKDARPSEILVAPKVNEILEKDSMTDEGMEPTPSDSKWNGIKSEHEEDRQQAVTTLPPDEASSTKSKDSRFRDLFSSQSARSGQDTSLENPNTNFDPPDSNDMELVDRYVAPSIHPATSALYIRDFMRPLNGPSLKDHLTLLATAPGETPASDTIVDFYLDPIRTHAFISFDTISAASRVRSELHNRIWPDERNRKPLWVDFIPSDYVRDWISEEQSTSGGPRSAGKKWEVVYSFDNGHNVTATLQEVGSLRAPAPKPSIISDPLPAPSLSGIEGAPSGPRAQQVNGQRALWDRDTLDILFKSTTAKPVLYFQPVSRELAEKRLDHIEDATSKNYTSRVGGPDINRYTFEDGDVLVDRGPEIFPGIRPPPGYRGRGGGGGGRGGYRNRGGDRYEGARRDGWDPRDRRY